MKKTNLLSIYFLIISLLVQSLLAESFSTNPILKVEAGMHTAVIRRISTDKENRILATASTDKTAKLWDLSTGKLLRTIRVPIEHGHEGKVNAVALSPDGSRLDRIKTIRRKIHLYIRYRIRHSQTKHHKTK